MKKDFAEFAAYDAQIVVVVRDKKEKVAEYWQENELPYFGVPDPDATLGNLYGQQWKALKLGLMPANFVVDRQGRIAFAHYSSGMSDIPSNESVLKILAGLAD